MENKCENCYRYTICNHEKPCDAYEDFYETCENCKYFGGLMCDHVNEQGECLGWEPIILTQKDKEFNKLIEEIMDSFYSNYHYR